MSKSEGPFTVCNCTDTNIRREQRKCITYCEGKKGYCAYYRSSIGACANYEDIFQELRIDSKVFFAFLKHNRFDLNLFSRNEVVIYHVSKTYA